MRRTLAELSPEGNPFRALEANAKILMPRQSNASQRTWVSSEKLALGALDFGTLAAYGLVSARQSVRSWETDSERGGAVGFSGTSWR